LPDNGVWGIGFANAQVYSYGDVNGDYAGARCVRSAGYCNSTDCSAGCCNGTSCEPGTADNACGAGGAACVACATGNHCVSQQCEPTYALSFDGVDDYVDVPDEPSLRLTGPMTVEAWVYVNSYPSVNADTIAMKADYVSSSNCHGWDIRIVQGVFGFTIMNNAIATAEASEAPPLQTWVHIAGTYNGTNIALWQDGALVVGKAATSTLGSSTADLLMGKDVNPNPYFDGIIDEVRLSNVVRYTAPFTPASRFTPDTNTVALWHFDEDQGTTLDDASGNGHNGAIYGATWVTGH
jgi:hypothetical protein